MLKSAVCTDLDANELAATVNQATYCAESAKSVLEYLHTSHLFVAARKFASARHRERTRGNDETAHGIEFAGLYFFPKLGMSVSESWE